MFRYYYFIIFLFLIASPLFSEIPYFLSNEVIEIYEIEHDHLNCSNKYHNHESFQNESKIIRRPYNVLNYDLFLDWTNPLSTIGNRKREDREYHGINKIKMQIDSNNVSLITLDAGRLLIDSVVLNGNVAIYNISVTNSVADIKLPSKYNKGDTITLSVFYKYSDTLNRGFYLYPKGNYGSAYIEERLTYTMSEPENARYWMPCNDNPHDKAFSSIAIKVPAEYTASSNGYLDSVSMGNNYKIFHWRETSPITTYLMVANASIFFTYSDYYKKVSNPSDSVEIKYYVWANDYNEDVNQGLYNAKRAFRNTEFMMNYFSRIYGEYPFSKYGLVALYPFNFGGMEDQTLTSIHRDYMKNYGENVLAHELAHQWLGNLITCATWNDIWINEGGATWSETLYKQELLQSEEQYYTYLNYQRKGYLDAINYHKFAIYGIPTAFIFNMYQLTYLKAGQVYHMLYAMLGKEKFLEGLREIFNRNKFTSLETYQYIQEFKKQFPNSPIDLDTFFDQWIYKSGHPELKIDYLVESKGNGEYNLAVTINQLQKLNEKMVSPPYFTFPVRLFVEYANRIDTLNYI